MATGHSRRGSRGCPTATQVPRALGGGVSELVRLHPDDREAIAVRSAQLVLDAVEGRRDELGDTARSTRTKRFDASAAEIAQRIGMSAAWVREHAADLGGVRVGTGTKSRHRFRFNVAITDERIAARRSDMKQPPSKLSEPQPKQRRRRPAQSDVPLLPIKGRHNA